MSDAAPASPLDPQGDAEKLEEMGKLKNHSKVGSSRPSTLLYTYGPGAIMDLPNFSIMPGGLEWWEHTWRRFPGEPPTIQAPALLSAVQALMSPHVKELRKFPFMVSETPFSNEADRVGVPARIFPQWMRCTGCDFLAPISQFEYQNDRWKRPDEAVFKHVPCRGRKRGGDGKERSEPNKGGKKAYRQAVPARYLLACVDGHLDEFPYEWWVHEGGSCAPGVEHPRLRMEDNDIGQGASARIICESCTKSRGMNEAQGEVGKTKLPGCRGRMPHLGRVAKWC